ncbi:MAG TPA: precorrin-3B C(17)-methyltransferase [Methanothermococcus okinawensis]|uniref:Precorrin-3B C(17)-methyltransferase n=1 Tax=Methanothermococcus okinawensis TaxID=155863 RepID=A0A832ZMB9_9EURY|nr:precorrin-3B C(17)-methyltransferase [Methanococcaceae archaeon]HIP83945.1 precorrin-3B C(17)-methyltransferase [Methanothermococcus okinawensis]HIP91536.1 precorrin-3B C(17)-methyltransferase [Methanothermococcus okinawensis]
MLYIVGIGPGGERYFTREAEEVLGSVDLIVCYRGYRKYIERFKKEIYTTGMRGEIERVRYALKEGERRDVALVSSGDPTIYGMASLAYELAERDNCKVTIKVVSGVTAASVSSGILGAPLNHDFAVVSLSDLLIPLEVILKRIRCALEGDFVLVLYNPLSKSRRTPFLKTLDIIKEYREKRGIDYIVGIVKNAGREGEEYRITTIEDIYNNLEEYMEFIDMNTTLIVGNTNTRIVLNKMITPRGYLNKYL